MKAKKAKKAKERDGPVDGRTDGLHMKKGFFICNLALTHGRTAYEKGGFHMHRANASARERIEGLHQTNQPTNCECQ